MNLIALVSTFFIIIKSQRISFSLWLFRKEVDRRIRNWRDEKKMGDLYGAPYQRGDNPVPIGSKPAQRTDGYQSIPKAVKEEPRTTTQLFIKGEAVQHWMDIPLVVRRMMEAEQKQGYIPPSPRNCYFGN